MEELKCHFWILDCLGVDREGVVVIHAGGVYGNKEKSLDKLVNTINSNPWLKERIAIENDERLYTVSDLIPLSEYDIPVVFDYYHHTLNPSIFNPEDVIDSWKGRRPEFHLSSKPKESHRFGEHGYWVDLKDFLELHSMFKGYQVDVVVEAKGKERAIMKLQEKISQL